MGRLTGFMMLCAVLLLTACPPREFHGKDFEMMRAAKLINEAIIACHTETSEWPDTLEQAKSYMPSKAAWPVNPYNGKHIADTFSPDFDPAKSVGMVYYQKLTRDEQVVNYQLHIFGDKGKLYIIGNTAVGMKE
jgi:hypothetical protein